MSPSSYQHFVGIDIAARTADVALLSAHGDVLGTYTIEQTSAGYRHLHEVLTRLRAIPEQTLVVMEATGTYWMKLAFWLYEAGFVVSVVNPLQTHHFAQLQLQRAKTDRIDAHLIAQFAWLHQPTAWTPPPPVYHALQQHLVQRDAFLLMRTQMKNHLHAIQQQHDINPLVVARYQDQIDRLSQQIAAIEVALET
jgi:transposase